MRYALAAVLLMLSLGPTMAQDCRPGTWREAAPLPQSRSEVTAATDGQSVFLLGGMTRRPDTDLLAVFRYQPYADRWSEIARLDTPVNHAGAVVIDGKLYVVGGYGGPRNAPTARLRVIDLATGELQDATPMPTPRGALVAVVLDGKIHALGGTTDRTVATHEVYDPKTDRWTQAAPMRVPRNHHAAAVFDGRIYVFGGRDETTFLLDAAEVFDPATGRWSDIAPLPTGRSGIGAAVSGYSIVVFGGEVAGAQSHTFANAEAYDPAADKWQVLLPMPTARHGLGVATIGGSIFVIAGGPQPGLTESAVNEVLCAKAG
jgi:N-acetylneuraminic acid mutarotase